MLARLANETGGRLTYETNDLSLAYARASRDQACRYTIGFYVPTKIEDAARKVALRVRRRGLRALYPNQYELRSADSQRSQQILAAFLAPGMFDGGRVRAGVIPLRPRSARTWDTVIVLGFPVRFESAENVAQIVVGATLNQGARIQRNFKRELGLELASDAPPLERWVLLLEPVALAPGEYDLTVVVTGATEREEPEARHVRIVVPPLSENEGERANRQQEPEALPDPSWLARLDIATGGGASEPLLVPLAGSTQKGAPPICVLGARPAAALEPRPRALSETCRSLFEVVPHAAAP